MKAVSKYNLCKGVSTVLTVGTPIITLACCGDMFVHRSDTAISAAGLFAILIALIFCKDKVVEVFKAPSALILSAVVFGLLILVENIMLPVKYVCIATIFASGVDELTVKRIYKQVESMLPDNYSVHKHFGFIFATTEQILGEHNEKE